MAEILVCDDELCTCGSTNIDFRSFENNFEANVFFYDRQLALRMKDIYLEDEAQSVDINYVDELQQRPFVRRLSESLIRLLSPLLQSSIKNEIVVQYKLYYMHKHNI